MTTYKRRKDIYIQCRHTQIENRGTKPKEHYWRRFGRKPPFFNKSQGVYVPFIIIIIIIIIIIMNF